MREFFAEFFRDARKTIRVIFIDDEGTAEPRQHRIVPARAVSTVFAAIALAILLTIALIAFTPLREWIPGYSTEEMRRDARLNALRLESLIDSLDTQNRYMNHLRSLMTGSIVAEDDELLDGTPTPVTAIEGPEPRFSTGPASDNWRDHRQPAFDLDVLPSPTAVRSELMDASERYLSSLGFPVVAPVEGIFTRGFAADIGHYGMDIAASEGSVVRSIGDGYVILADWTHDGGHALAIQHARGYISIYKHNQRLLKNVGDRVRDREPVALSGNSGEITTGPHLHFELWQNGLAQDPSTFFLSL